MRTIALKGKGEIGKTTAIKLLVSSFNTFGYKFESLIFKEVELLAKIEINGLLVGITTRGDNVTCLEDDFKDLGECDLYVCACRTRGKTIQFLKNRNAEFIEAKGKPRDDKTEFKWANLLYRKIVNE